MNFSNNENLEKSVVGTIGVSRRNSLYNDIFVFVIGLLSAYYLNVGGQLYLAELVLPLIFVLLWRRRSYLLSGREAKWLLFSGGAWFFSQALADIIRSTPLSDLLRGWAAIVIFLIDFFALYFLLFPNPHRILVSFTGFAVGGILQPILQPDQYFLVDSWKFGYSIPLTLLILLLGSMIINGNLRRNFILAVFMTFIGIYSIYVGTRSVGGIALLTAAILFLRSVIINKIFMRRFHFFNIIVIGAMLIFLAWGILYIYSSAAQSGWLGERAYLKYQMQSGGVYGILIGGRVETITALYAIRDSPILGYGSWARDPEYRAKLYELIRLGYYTSADIGRLDYVVTASDKIPVHSHILQAWVWSGAIGAIFWLGVLVIVVHALVIAIRKPGIMFALTIFAGLFSIWNLLFSNFGSVMRLEWAYFLVLFLYTIFSPSLFSIRIR